jgi:glycosyltransferase involved in cell wall biosynthesis
MTVFTEMLLQSQVKDRFDLLHVDTIDHHRNPNMGRFNPSTFLLALTSILSVFKAIISRRPTLVYMPISPTVLGLLRDSILILGSGLLRRKVVIHLHGGRYIQDVYQLAPRAAQIIVRWACKNVDRVVVEQASFVDAFKGLVPKERITVISNGVEDPVPQPVDHLAHSQGPLDARRVVTYLSTMQESKGYLDFIEAARLVAMQRNDVRFVAAGTWLDEKDKKGVINKVEEDGWASRVEFPGTVIGRENRAALLLAAHVFVLPSYYPYEGQPLILLEAMAAGLPIVTTDHGALPAIVVRERNGLIVPTRDPIALAQDIARLLDDDELRERIGRTNRAEYLEKYTADMLMRRIGDLFDDVLSG